MSGRLHHPLDVSADPDVGSNPTEEEADRLGQDSSSQAQSTVEGESMTEHDQTTQVPWTAGVPVESAATIANDEAPGRFSRMHAAGADTANDFGPGQPEPGQPEPGEPEPGQPGLGHPELGHPDGHGGLEGWHTAEPADTFPTEPVASEATGARVQLPVWLDAELRRRVTAAHERTAADEGYDSLSDYVGSVLDQDVERLERTYNGGTAFPGGQAAPTHDGTLAYQVRARHSDGLWELRIAGEGVTLSPTLAGAETMARTYLGLLHGVPADDIAVDVVPELPDGLSEEITTTGNGISRAEAGLEQAQAALAMAADELRQAREARHALLDRLRANGLSDADTDTVLALMPIE